MHFLSLLITINCQFQFFLLAISILTQEFTHSQYKEEPSYSLNKTSKKKKEGGNYLITLNDFFHNVIHT